MSEYAKMQNEAFQKLIPTLPIPERIAALRERGAATGFPAHMVDAMIARQLTDWLASAKSHKSNVLAQLKPLVEALVKGLDEAGVHDHLILEIAPVNGGERESYPITRGPDKGTKRAWRFSARPINAPRKRRLTAEERLSRATAFGR